MPKVSITIPAYNAEAYLAETLDSVFAQRFGDFEVVVVNDNSSDGTAEVVRGYNDPRLRLVEFNSGGCYGQTFNRLQEAAGDYIFIFHADDVLDPEDLATRIPFLEDHPEVGWSHSNIQQIDDKGKPIAGHDFKLPAENQIQQDSAFFSEVFRSLASRVIASTVIIRRSVLAELKEFDPRFPKATDMHFYWRLAHLYPAAYFASPKVRYRIHDGQDSSKGYAPGKILEYYQAKKDVLDRYPAIEGRDEHGRFIQEQYADYALERALECLNRGRLLKSHFLEARDFLNAGAEVWPGVTRTKAYRSLDLKVKMGPRVIGFTRKLRKA